ncbi:MAG: hypothetical protein ABSG53_00505 [Thermoguttaceae bacterium]|jgi:sorbitol-specific phosphotransferase system component IIA
MAQKIVAEPTIAFIAVTGAISISYDEVRIGVLQAVAVMHDHRVAESDVLSGERFTVGETEIIVRYAGRAQTAIEAAAKRTAETFAAACSGH